MQPLAITAPDGRTGGFAFTVEGKPRGKGRHRRGRNRHTGAVVEYTDDQTRAYEAAIGWACKRAMAGRPPLAGPVGVALTVFLAPPEKITVAARAKMLAGEILPLTKPDIDNVQKALLDGLNKIAFADDARVVEACQAKFYDIRPRIEVEVWPITPPAAQPEGAQP